MSKLNIIGDGAFGSFLKELLVSYFTFSDNADSVLLATPLSSYNELGYKYKDKHLINVCSCQKPSTDILLKHTSRVTSIHPLFGRRTPEEKRNSILTHSIYFDAGDSWYHDPVESDFIMGFQMVSKIISNITPDDHDRIMAKTHLAAWIVAEQAKVIVDRAKDIPDEYIPNSFRLLREFVKTLEDMPKGTIDSIMANPYN